MSLCFVEGVWMKRWSSRKGVWTLLTWCPAPCLAWWPQKAFWMPRRGEHTPVTRRAELSFTHRVNSSVSLDCSFTDMNSLGGRKELMRKSFPEEVQSVLAEMPFLSAPLLRGPHQHAGIADCMLTSPLLRVGNRAAAPKAAREAWFLPLCFSWGRLDPWQPAWDTSGRLQPALVITFPGALGLLEPSLRYLQAGQRRRQEGLPGGGCCCPQNSSGSIFLAQQPSSSKQAKGFHLLL